MDGAGGVAPLTSRPRAVLAATLILTLLVPHATAMPARDADAAPDGAAIDTPSATAARELVVVIHGLIRTPRSMRPVVRALEREGFEVLTFGYSSTCCEIPEIAADLRTMLSREVRPEHERVHFVGHSMGNILVRYLLAGDSVPPRVGRVVMLAPPNQGAEFANTMSPLVGWLLKPTAELRADSGATVRHIPPVRGVEIGVIAARDDDTVKLPETHLPEEKEHIVVDGGHSFIMNRRDVHQLTVAFLRHGTFQPPGEPQGTSVTRSP